MPILESKRSKNRVLLIVSACAGSEIGSEIGGLDSRRIADHVWGAMVDGRRRRSKTDLDVGLIYLTYTVHHWCTYL